MSVETFKIRPVCPEDGPAVVELRRRMDDLPVPEKNDLSFWRWENLENPYGTAFAMLAEREGVAVSNFSLLPRKLRIGTRVIQACLSVESMTERRYRAKGLFPRLWLALEPLAREAGVDVFYGFPNSKSRPIFQRVFHWTDVGSPDLFCYPLRPQCFLRSRGIPFSSLASLPGSIYRGIFRPKQAANVRPLINFNSCNQALVESLHPETSIVPERTVEYLNWRYTNVPGRDYMIHGLFSVPVASPAGFVVTRRTSHEGVDLAVVMEICLGPHVSRRNANILLSAVLADMFESGVDVALGLAMPGDPVRLVLGSAGFIRLPRRLAPHRFDLMVHGAGNAVPRDSLSDPACWRISFGDIDVF